MRTSVPYSFLLLALSFIPTATAQDDGLFTAEEWMPQENVIGGNTGSISLRSLFGLDGRQTDDSECITCPAKPDFCCKPGKNCCATSDYCVETGGVCCGTTGTCKAGWKCCTQDGCAPNDGVCCDDGKYCNAGYACAAGGRCSRTGGPTGTATTSSRATSTTSASMSSFTFTVTWYYFSYYWTVIQTSTLTSTEYTTSTTIEVTATDRPAAIERFDSITSTMSFPTPAAATTANAANDPRPTIGQDEPQGPSEDASSVVTAPQIWHSSMLVVLAGILLPLILAVVL